MLCSFICDCAFGWEGCPKASHREASVKDAFCRLVASLHQPGQLRTLDPHSFKISNFQGYSALCRVMTSADEKGTKSDGKTELGKVKKPGGGLNNSGLTKNKTFCTAGWQEKDTVRRALAGHGQRAMLLGVSSASDAKPEMMRRGGGRSSRSELKRPLEGRNHRCPSRVSLHRIDGFHWLRLVLLHLPGKPIFFLSKGHLWLQLHGE